MKKVSTVGAKPSKKISQQKLTVGLDLGDRNSWYCVLDESGQIQISRPNRPQSFNLPGSSRSRAYLTKREIDPCPGI